MSRPASPITPLTHDPTKLALAALCALAVALFLGGCSVFDYETSAPRMVRRPDLTPLPPLKAPGEPEMRVRLAARQSSATVGGPQEVRIAPLSEKKQTRVLSAPVQFALSALSWSVTDGRGRQTSIPRSGYQGMDPLVVNAVGPRDLTFAKQSYPGEIRLQPRVARTGGPTPESPVFDVVEFVPLERYLPGVISRELFPNWSLDAYKAQTVAARTYAIQEKNRSMAAGESFDVEAGEQDQAYGGHTLNATAQRAVAETRGQILKWNGQVLRAYYSSTCGGRAGSAKDTWPTRAGYEFNLAAPIQGSIRPRDCPCGFSGRYRWTVTRDKAEFVRRLSAYGTAENMAVRALTSLSRITTATMNAAGRPASYRIYDAAGKWYPLSAEQLRLACNTAAEGLPPIDAKSRVFSGDLTFTVSPSTIKIEGRGFGHGVGLCQYGAEGLAREGQPWDAIVRFYYPGALIEKAY